MLKQRREAMKEIFEADTDPMKEVLCLGATFAPTQQIMFSNLVQGGKLWRRSLRLQLRATFVPTKLIIFQLVIDQSFKLIEKALKIKKRFLKVVGVVSPLLLPLPTKTSSLSCEAFSISSKFDLSLVEGKKRWAWCWTKGGRPWRRSLKMTLTPWKRCYASVEHLLPLNKLCCQIWSKEGHHEGDHWSWSHEGSATPQGNIWSKEGNHKRRPLRRSLRLTLSPWRRYYTLGQQLLPLPLNKLCCQIWVKEGDHEGFWQFKSHLLIILTLFTMQLYSLTWNTYSDHLKKSTMVMNEDFSDVILVTEDKKQMRVQHHANQCFPSMFN